MIRPVGPTFWFALLSACVSLSGSPQLHATARVPVLEDCMDTAARKCARVAYYTV